MITQPANLISFLTELKEAHIAYRLGHNRDDAITVEIAVPGERWEAEFHEDGTVEVEVFRSDGTIHDSATLHELLDKHAS